MSYSKDSIVQEYKDLKKHLGHPPSFKEFRTQTGVDLKVLGKFFGGNAYSKLVIECGDTPNVFNTQKSELEDILIQWGKLVRKFGKIPPSAEWSHNNCRPTVDSIRKSHKMIWTDFGTKFSDFFMNSPEWEDVIKLIPIKEKAIVPPGNATIKSIEGTAFEYDKFIPPVVRELHGLSMDKERAIEFERRVGLLFQMLGFEVNIYGQGTGRNPDIVAESIKERYAILIDAKARKDSYRVGTEDRKFIEYIQTHKRQLSNRGFEIVYFLVVSSGFNSDSNKALENIASHTGVSTTLLTAQQLLKILARKIEYPNKFDLLRLKKIFVESGIVTDKQLIKIIN